MHKKAIFILLSLFGPVLLLAQSRYTISGTVTDKKNGETIIGATVFVSTTGAGTATNAYGFYSVTLPAGKHQLIFRTVGYINDTVDIDLKNDIKLNKALADQSRQMDEVVITAKKKRRQPAPANYWYGKTKRCRGGQNTGNFWRKRYCKNRTVAARH